MYFNHDEIVTLCQNGLLENWDESCVNAASIDVRLGDTIFVEDWESRDWSSEEVVLDYSKRDKMQLKEVKMDHEGYVVRPGQFFLAHTLERCNFPDDVAALFRIKSSQGRIGMEHMDAGWVDPGFHGVLTLEFKNVTLFHAVRLRPGDRVGQLILFQGLPVDPEKSYRKLGNYNGADGVMQAGYKR